MSQKICEKEINNKKNTFGRRTKKTTHSQKKKKFFGPKKKFETKNLQKIK